MRLTTLQREATCFIRIGMREAFIDHARNAQTAKNAAVRLVRDVRGVRVEEVALMAQRYTHEADVV